MAQFTSGCTPQVLEVRDDGTFWTNGAMIAEPHWPEAVQKWTDLINAAAVKHDVAPGLIAGVMAGESRGNPKAGSPVGALGLMQVMPQYFGGNAGGRLYDPATNIEEGVGFLAELQEMFAGNPVKMLAGYNAGSARCRASAQWGLVQNTGYINKCLGYANHAGTLGFSLHRPSVSPPPLVSIASMGPGIAIAGMALGAVGYMFADIHWGWSDRVIDWVRDRL